MSYTKWRADWRDEADPDNSLPGATSIDAGFFDQTENTFVSQDNWITALEGSKVSWDIDPESAYSVQRIRHNTQNYLTWTGVLGDEPGSYITVTNPTPITGSGEAGVFWGAVDVAGSVDFRTDDVLIDTNPGA